MAEEFNKKNKNKAGLELSEDLIKAILDSLKRPNTLL
jgi:hypothetical protein